jgi:hypothetical protein
MTFDELSKRPPKDLDWSDYERDGELHTEEDPIVAIQATEAVVTVVGQESDGSNTYPVTRVFRIEFDTPGDLSDWLDTSQRNVTATQEIDSAPRWKTCGHPEDETDARCCDEPTCKNYNS